LTAMNLHELRNTPGSVHRRVRVCRGRSAGRGKTGGRGTKGQMSRKGHKHKEGFEGGQMRLVRRIPKRGFKSPTRREFCVVSVGALNRFEPGTVVTADVLRSAGLVKQAGSPVKLLGDGNVDRKLEVRLHAFSASARAKIEAAGGVCKVAED